jgi:regulator of cell morphogenesis and NO signaling
MIERLETAMVGDIVARDFRAAAVFEAFGIDFCCGGRRSLSEACTTAAADPADVIHALDRLSLEAIEADDIARGPLEGLIDHIVTTHHAYVRTALPTIAAHLTKLHNAHGARHPELARIAVIFAELTSELTQHMVKEEQVLFPYVRDLAEHSAELCGRLISPFGSVENPIRMMEREHEHAGAAMRLIREMTNGYVAPHDGCTTYRVCMAELAQFERDLHRHVYLENNALFPRALGLENRSAGDNQ